MNSKKLSIINYQLSIILSVLAFLLPALAYLFTLAPDITWAYHGADAGDLITAAYTLGVPHPSGYPTYILTSWLFSHLPVGSIAWRFNLFSALSMAGASWLLFKIVKQHTQSPISALLAALNFAFIPLIWSQAIITEVYALNSFFVALLIYLSDRRPPTADRRFVSSKGYNFILGFILALALGVHLTILFLLPVLIGRWGKLNRWSMVNGQWSMVGFLFGLTIFLYLPLRAGQGAITWGQPDTLTGFLDLISGSFYRNYLFAVPSALLGGRILAFINYLTQLGLIGLIFAAIGLKHLWHHHNTLFWGGFISSLAYIFYALTYNTLDSYIYLLPVFFLLNLAVGLGLNEIFGLIQTRPYKIVAHTLILTITLILAIITGFKLDLRHNLTAQNFWQAIFAQAPPNAVLLTTGAEQTFTLWYAHYVLQHRPDIAIVDIGLVAYPWHQTNLKQNNPTLTQVGQLPTIFKQKTPYHRPICQITPFNVEEDWVLDCTQ